MENIVVINNENFCIKRNGEVDIDKFTKLLIEFFCKYIDEEENTSSSDCLKH